MKGRFSQGWFRDPGSGFPNLVLKVTKPAGPGMRHVITPYDRDDFGHPIGAGNGLTRAVWERLEATEAPSWASGDEFADDEEVAGPPKRGRRRNMEAEGGWMATFETGGAEARAFGSTPEEAVDALVGAWRAYCDDSGGDPSYVAERREDVTVARYATGSGYVLGGHDRRWFKDILGGAEPRFDEAFGTGCAPRPAG